MKKIDISYKEPGGIIWKILPDETGEYLVVESRDGKLRKIMLSTLNVRSGIFVFKNEQLPKPWWLGLKAVGYNKIILQGYKESNSPEPKGIYVFELSSGKLLWKEEEMNFDGFVNDRKISLLSLVEEGASIHEVNSFNGELINEKLETVFSTIDKVEINQLFPILYSEENEHYKTIVDFLYQDQHYKSVGPLEYLEYETLILLSFYIQENNKLTNILLVLDGEGNSILNDRLIEGADGIGMSSFFVCKNKLVYIKNKTSIALAELI